MEYQIKPGWQLNPNEKVVKGITKLLEKNNMVCPCVHMEDDGDLRCPCESYRLRDKCCCKLYIKLNKNENKG